MESNGYLLIEHGFDQGQAVRDYFKTMSFINIKTVKDFANKLWKKHKSKQKIIYNAVSKKNGYHSMYSDKASLI